MPNRRSEKGEAPKQVRALQGFLIQNPDKERIMANSTQVTPIRAITVPFHGADLYVVEYNGQPYTPMKPIVEGMGLAWQPQHRKLAANQARWGMVEIAIPSAGGAQAMVGSDLNHHHGDAGQRRAMTAVPLRKLPGWLATIDPGRVKREDARAKVVQYQNECDDVLWQYWNEGVAINPRTFSVQPGQTLSAEQAETLRTLLTDRVKKLPKDQQARAMVQGWSKLKAHFKTGYRHIPAEEFHEAVNILARHVAEWEVVDEEPPTGTVDETVAHWVGKIESPNGYPASLFMPLVEAVLRKAGKRVALVHPGQILVDRSKLAALWTDLGKISSRVDALGCIDADCPPSWWAEKAIT